MSDSACPLHESLVRLYGSESQMAAAGRSTNPAFYSDVFGQAIRGAPECPNPDTAIDCGFRARALEMATRMKYAQPNTYGVGTELNRLFREFGFPEMQL